MVHRGVFHLAVAVVSCGFVSHQARADAVYSVINLGTADPSGNYLGALSAGQQSAFRAGSFDVYSHPATVSNLPAFYSSVASQADIFAPSTGNGTETFSNIVVTTSNNLGVNAGIANESSPAPGMVTQAVVFTPDPHTISVPNSFAPSWSTPTLETSPGYLSMVPTSTSITFSQFIGKIAGINDQRSLALTESNFSSNGQQVQNPKLFTNGQGDASLGSLGGTNGVANALNNSNQVVGWSQIANGAQHAFLYANGSMQDLNSLIPSSSGFVLTSAVGIDSAGDIVAYGTSPSGQTDEYLLTPTPLLAPVPEPSALAVMGLMIVALAARHAGVRRHSNRK